MATNMLGPGFGVKRRQGAGHSKPVMGPRLRYVPHLTCGYWNRRGLLTGMCEVQFRASLSRNVELLHSLVRQGEVS